MSRPPSTFSFLLGRLSLKPWNLLSLMGRRHPTLSSDWQRLCYKVTHSGQSAKHSAVTTGRMLAVGHTASPLWRHREPQPSPGTTTQGQPETPGDVLPMNMRPSAIVISRVKPCFTVPACNYFSMTQPNLMYSPQTFHSSCLQSSCFLGGSAWRRLDSIGKQRWCILKIREPN